ncbi:MAG TPA: PP2C family protein-serine/threonine phosphatase [Candidatus Sulfotelmatobacter sp.]|nr:PP2C family protein-serine/threonine phosphatase [Candidatus Sulfotelmatobacter sp.]
MGSVAQIRGRYQDRKRTGSAAAPQSARQPRRGLLEKQFASLKREHDDLRRAVYEAAQVQRRLCGPRHLHVGSYAIASEIFPLRHLSGDFISVLQIEGDLVFALGDIAGKGIMAAMWFTQVMGMIRRQMVVLGDPAAALSSVNRELLLTGFEVPLTTLFLGRINLESGDLVYCNAGHPPALLLRENNEVEELRAGGPVLGAISRASFANGSVRLCPGTTLLAYSDGIPECRNESGIEFGATRLLNTVRAFSGCKPSHMLFSVLAAVENFMGRQRREDDVALVVVHRFDSCKVDRSDTHCA